MRPAGLILAGGRSLRFGSEKALALYDGRPLLAFAHDALAGVCGSVAVSARPGSGASALAQGLGCPALVDPPGLAEGPLAGVLAGLDWAKAAGWPLLVILPCDTPGLQASHLRRLIEALPPEAGVAAARSPTGLEALCAVVRTSARDKVANALADGRHPPVRALWAELGLAEVAFEDARAFANVNRPEDLD